MPIPVRSGTVVSLEVEMLDAQGVQLQAPAPLAYVHGGHGGLPDALEAALEGKLPGEAVTVQLEPEQAFGDYDADLLHVEPAARYGEGLAVGMQVEESFGGGDSRIYTVTDLAEGKVVLDGNHPLAGLALRFVCKVVAVRNASPEEIRQGISLPQG